MKLKLLFILFLNIPFLINSQTTCGTPTPQHYQQFGNATSKQQASNDIFCLNISFHIVRETNDSGGFSTSNIDNIIQILNEDYNRYGIFFNEVNVDFISDDAFHDLIYTDEDRSMLDALFSQNDDPNAIDFYLVGSLTIIDDGETKSLGGVASSVLSSDLIVSNSNALSNTSTHEIGHALNLLHTHEIKYGIENITRDPTNQNYNCDEAGDWLCDTEADPNIFGLILTGCEYDEGDGFNPPVHNYMSYSRKSCRDEFTPGQVAVIKDALATQAILQPVISSSCAIPVIGGPDLVCNSTTYTLQNGGSNVTWQTSSNLHATSQSNSGITVEPEDFTTNGNGYIEATINNATYRKDIWIGKPKLNNAAISGLGSVDCSSTYIFDYTGSVSGATSTRWVVSPQFDDVSNVNDYELFVEPTNGGSGYVTFVATNNCGETLICIPVEVDGLYCGPAYNNFPNTYSCSSSNLSSKSSTRDYMIYPNPATNTITINKKELVEGKNNLSAPDEQSSFKLFNFNAVLLSSGNFKGMISLDLSPFKKGKYILQIVSGKNSETHHIILK